MKKRFKDTHPNMKHEFVNGKCKFCIMNEIDYTDFIKTKNKMFQELATSWKGVCEGK